MSRKYTLLLILGLGLYLSAYGCAALVAGGAAAGGTYIYTEGWVGRDYRAGLDSAYNASLQAAQKLDMSVVERKKDVASANIKARKSETDYWIKIEEKGDGLTNVSVRAGIMGDKEASQKIHEQIETLVAERRKTTEPRAQKETQRQEPRAQAGAAPAAQPRASREPARVEQQPRPQAAPGERSMQLQYSAIDVDDAQDWVGRKLMGANDKELGTVNSLYSPEGNKVLYVIVEGDGGRMHPIPAQMIKEDEQNNRLTAQIEKERFEQSPSFSVSERPQLEEQRWSEEIRSFYEKK